MPVIQNSNGTNTPLNLQGSGILYLTGNNSYSGSTSISGGTLQVGSSTAIPGATTLAVNGGVFDLHGNNVSANLAAGAAAGTITDNSTGTGTTTLTGTVTGISGNALNPALKDGANGQHLAVVLVGTNNNTSITGLNSSNNFTGSLTLKGVQLTTVTSGLGASTNTIYIGQSPSDYGQLYYNVGSTVTIPNPIVVNTSQGVTGAAGGAFDIYSNGYNVNLTGNITANATASFINGGGSGNFRAFNVTGQITGAGGVSVGSTSGWAMQLILGNTSTTTPNSYQGNTTVTGGGLDAATLQLAASNQIPAGSTVVLNNSSGGAILDLEGFSDTINGLSGAGTVQNSGALSTLTLAASNATSVYTGGIQNAINLTKTGTGMQTLSGANTYTGTTTITAGTLALGNNLALQDSPLYTRGGGSLALNSGITTPTIGGLSGSATLPR